MNALIFKLKLSLLLVITISSTVTAQKMKGLIPDGVLVQHAGSIGYFSGGVNYKLFKNQRGSLDIMAGILPKSQGGGFTILTSKFAWRPFEVKVNNWLILHPVNPGAFLSYTIDNDFDIVRDRDLYRKGYYYLPEALHLHITLGSELRLNTVELLDAKKIKALTLYYELNASDMYLANYIQNTKALSVADIFKAGVGIKASF